MKNAKKEAMKMEGYSDNMLITFILSAEINNYHIKHPPKKRSDNSLKKIDIID